MLPAYICAPVFSMTQKKCTMMNMGMYSNQIAFLERAPYSYHFFKKFIEVKISQSSPPIVNTKKTRSNRVIEEVAVLIIGNINEDRVGGRNNDSYCKITPVLVNET